jgi:hypothetical protein
MSCIQKIKHDSPTCTSEKGLQVFYDDQTDKYTGYCFSCAAKGLPAYVKDPYNGQITTEKPKGKTKEEKEAEVAEVRALPSPKFDYRSIPASYFERARVKLALSEYDGKTPWTLNFPMTLKGKLLGYKTVLLKDLLDFDIDDKGVWSTGDTKGADLINWEIAKSRKSKRLYITEGQWDMLALEYMLEKDYKAEYAVVSIPNGVKSAATTIGRQRKEIEALFEEVVLVFDGDEAGENAVKEVQKVMPSILEVPHLLGVKDANEALQKGKWKEFVDYAKWKARKPLRQGVVSISQVMEAALKEPSEGLSLPWASLSKLHYGQSWGDCTCVAGAVGSGKTLIAHEGAAWNMTTHKEPTFVALLEEANIKTCWNVAAKIDSIPYNKPEVFEANKERYYETVKSLEDKLYLWSSGGNTQYRFDLSEILSAVRFNYMEYGCRVAYIDNMTRVVDQMPTAEANEFINKYSSEIANLAAELGMHIYLFSHLNPPKGKDAVSHEAGGEIYPVQLTGSRGVMRSFPNIWGFERNQYAEGDRQHLSYLVSLKNRDHGQKAKIKTAYTPSAGRLKEFNWEGDSLY